MAGTRTKRLAMAVLPAAATTVALAAGVGPAGANTTTAQHTYTDNDGFQRTCTVNMTRTVPFNGDGQVGEGGTSVTNSANCSGIISYISAAWNDPDGLAKNSGDENSDGQSTFRRFAPIGDSFTTFHHVDFAGVPNGCIADCEFFGQRSK